MKALAPLLNVAALTTMLAASPGASAQELGRLFFTPEQRSALDARRKARVPDKPAALPQVETPTTRIDGAVRRSGGRSTVWVNGETLQESAQPEGVRVAAQEPAGVSLPANAGGEGSQRYQLRVGQTLDRGSGEVRDLIGAGGIRISPRPAATGR